MNAFKILNPIKILPPKMTVSSLVAKQMQDVIGKNVPKEAVEYCYQLWHDEPFSFKISRTRSTCLGNYIYRDGIHKITLNHDLNTYSFLVTYIHEIAHQRAWLDGYGKKRKIEPHGNEWKRCFQTLMKPILNASVFPEKILIPLSNYMQNPMASSVSHAPLAEALRSFDKDAEQTISLLEMPDNQWFEFRGTIFQKLELRRTRVLCLEKISKKRYLILGTARVKSV